MEDHRGAMEPPAADKYVAACAHSNAFAVVRTQDHAEALIASTLRGATMKPTDYLAGRPLLRLERLAILTWRPLQECIRQGDSLLIRDALADNKSRCAVGVDDDRRSAPV